MITVGFIGLGSQGGPMARRIVDAGFPLLLWARRADSFLPYADTAAKRAATVAALGGVCEHVGVCVVDDAGVRQVCAELIPALRPGSRLAIHSTVHPDTVVALAQQAAARGVAVLDAPVSGGGPAAAAGKLTVMVGASVADFAAAQPVFATFGGTIVRVGEVGAGQMTKLVNNSLLAANMALAHCALSAGQSYGLDQRTLAEIIKVSSGRSYGFEITARLPNLGAFAHGAKLLAKDVRLLGEVLGDDPSNKPFRELAAPFLDLMQKGSTP
jgi:3-hydroxyisobutyrate dehydrogenase-like beta-hydroxyacid dehydrogenase